MKPTEEMTTAKLDAIARAIDPHTRIVPARCLRRISKGQNRLGPLGLHLIHRRSLVVPTKSALSWVGAEDLELPGDGPPSEHLLLIQEPIVAMNESEALLWIWRRLFHLRVHVALDLKIADGSLTPEIVASRIREIGAGEFAEARAVLDRDSWLVSADDVNSYVEFVAVYLELTQFAPQLLHSYFPRIDDFVCVDSILAKDVDCSAIAEATRPPDAPDPTPYATEDLQIACPPPISDGESRRSDAQARRLLRRADAARKVGNLVRSAISRTRAARLVGKALAGQARSGAMNDLGDLTARVLIASGVEGQDPTALRSALASLLVGTCQSVWSVEARLLYDLQKVCLDSEQEVFALQFWRALFSRRRIPAKRPLPLQQPIRISKHLRQATARLAKVRIDPASRATLTAFLENATKHAEHALRERFRPLIATSLHRSELQARNIPEKVSFDRMVEELEDRLVERNYFNMGEVRDAIARSDLRQPDLTGPQELYDGDRVLKANRRLKIALDGVYRPAEIYLRIIQYVSLLIFGTRVGRWLVRFIAIPYGGAFGALKTVEELLGFIRIHVNITHGATVAVLGTLLLLLLHSKRVFWLAKTFTLTTLTTARVILIDIPYRFFNRPAIRAVLGSRWFDLVRRLILLPVLCAGLTYGLAHWFERDKRISIGFGIAAFLLSILTLGTSAGREVEEVATDSAIRGWRTVKSDLLPGLFQFILDVFSVILETVERVVYAVDEKLRFRSGDGKKTLIFKAIFGEIWGVVTYVVRIYLNLLVEPTINPIKHFPTVTVAAKMIIPVLDKLYLAIFAVFTFLGKWPAGSIAALTVLFLPGLAGFIVWELKENWKLFEATRPVNLPPIMVGHHGETMRRMLLRGFHSGTIPKSFAKLRQAKRRAGRTGEFSKARNAADAIHHIEEPIRHVAERGFLATLAASGRFEKTELTLHEVHLSTNRVRFEFTSAASAEPLLHVAIENADGKIVTTITEDGWRSSLEAIRRDILDAALIVMAVRCATDQLVFPPDSIPQSVRVILSGGQSSDAPVVRWCRWVDFWGGDPLIPEINKKVAAAD